MIGTPNIMAKVSRSRPSWRTSLVIMAPSRRRKPAKLPFSIVTRLSHQVDEDVLQRRFGLLPLDRGIGAIGLDRLAERVTVGAADMQRRAEGRGGGDAGRVAQLHRQPIGARPGGDEGDQARGLDDLLG